MEKNQVDINLSSDIKTDRATPLNITLMSRDINNNQFRLSFTNNGEKIQLNDSFTVEVLSVFQKTKNQVLTTAGIYGYQALWSFDTKFISGTDVVFNYVYIKKDGVPIVSADANAFTFDVGLSEIDKDAGRVAEVYDENYQRYLNEFKDNVDFEEIAQAEQERKEAEILRQESYDVKVDTAIVEADVVSKVDNKVTELTPQITNLTAQLAQKANQSELEATGRRIDGLIVESGDSNAEVTDAHVSIIKNKTFETIGNRLNESERDFRELSSGSPIINLIDNAKFNNTSNWESARATLSASNNQLEVIGKYEDFDASVYQVVNVIPNHIYYFSSEVKASTDKVYIAVHSSSTGRDYHSGSGMYERLSARYLTGDVTERQIQIKDGRNVGEVKDYYYVEKPMFIDLTETFGLGNEPTKEEMDEFLNDYFTDGWFNGGASLDGYFKYMDRKINDVDNLTNQLRNDIESVDNKVELIKPTHLVKGGGKNKFDKTKALPFTTIGTTGDIQESPYDWRTSDYIPVESNQKIAINKARFVAEYDENKVFIEGTRQNISPEDSSVFTTSSNTQFIRVTTLSNNVDNLQVEINSAPTAYEEHYYSIFIDDKKVYDLKEGGSSLMIDADLLTLKDDYTKFVDRKNYQIWQAKDWNSKKIKAIYKDIAVRVQNYSIGKFTIEISTTGINGSYDNVIEFNDTNFPNLIANSGVEYVMLLPWTRNFTSGQGAKDWRMVVMTNRGQMYHNFPSRATNSDGSEVTGDMTRFDESVIWDLPERKFPSKDINAAGVERYYPVLPDKSYQYHPPINTDNGYGNGGFDKSVTKGSVTYPRFYFPNRESVNNSLTPMGGYEPDDKITLLGTYRSNVKEGEAVRICLFATDDGGRSWYTKYEFGSEGKLAPNFTNSINTSSLASSYTTNSFSLSKRDNVLPTSENKEPSTKFSWSTNVPITDITRAQKSVVTTATPHGLSSGNVIAIKRNQSGSDDWAFLLNDNVSETSGGNGLLYRVKVLTSTTFELYEFVHSAHNNLPARHIHFINRIKDGWLFGTGEMYPQGWVMYMQMKAADTFYPKRAHEDFLIIRLTSSNGAVERLLGATMFDDPDSTMLVAMDNETTTRDSVAMPPGRTESFSRSSTGIFKGKLSDIDDMSKFYPVYEAKQVSYFFKEKGGAFIWGGQRGEFAISLDKGETWLTENLDGVIWHFYGESKKVIAIDDFIFILKQ